MTILYEHLEPSYPLGWRYLHFGSPVLPLRLHAHRQYELVYVMRGVGTRFIGDSVEEYREGDLVLIGPNLVHTHASIPDGGMNEIVVVHFRRDFLGEQLFDLPAFAAVSEMLEASANGVWFPNAPSTLTGLDELPPAEKTVALLDILVALSRQQHISLATGRSSAAIDPATAGRIEAIVTYVHENYRFRISLQDVADVVHMNASAVSRLFSRSMTLTLTRYITIVRLNAACRLLRDTDQQITFIASECGFDNLSNFNRRFRAVKKRTPKEYRSLARSGMSDTDTMEQWHDVKAARDVLHLYS